jgi:twinfilin
MINEAALIVFCLDVRAQGIPSKWVLLAWVPDDCKVRDKMLYSSSREDLKRSLGLGYFVGEYYANTRADLTWTQFVDYIARERTDGPLTMKEQLILEEKALTHSESHSTKATAMGALPFELSPDVIAALAQLQAGEVNWVEMTLNQETVELAGAKEVDPKEPLQLHVSATDARCAFSSSLCSLTQIPRAPSPGPRDRSQLCLLLCLLVPRDHSRSH